MLACIWLSVNVNATCVCMCLQCMGLFTRMCTELVLGKECSLIEQLNNTENVINLSFINSSMLSWPTWHAWVIK